MQTFCSRTKLVSITDLPCLPPEARPWILAMMRQSSVCNGEKHTVASREALASRMTIVVELMFMNKGTLKSNVSYGHVHASLLQSI